MLTVGVIGCGYWGPNLIRNLVENRRCREVIACDLDQARLEPLPVFDRIRDRLSQVIAELVEITPGIAGNVAGLAAE